MTKKSTDARSLTWFMRKARQVGEGGFLGRAMYFSTFGFAELGELAHDARGAPAWVRHRHLADEGPDLLGHRRPANPREGEASPVVPEPATLPGDYGARSDEEEHVAPAGPGPRQPRPEEAISDLDAGASATALVNGELVAQSEDLELKGGPGAKAGAERGGEGKEDCSHERSSLPRLGGGHCDC